MADGISIKVEWRGLDQAERVVTEAADRLQRDADRISNEIAATEAGRIRTRARTQGKLASRVAATVGANGPRLTLGEGRLMLSGRSVDAADVAFGAEFGGGARPTTRQFRPHTGTTGYFFWPTLREDAPAMYAAYEGALADLEDRWDN